MLMQSLRISRVVLIIAAVAVSGSAVAAGDQPLIGLIIKTSTNPYFVTLKNAAEKKAAAMGVEMQSFAGKYDGDNQTQVRAVENLVASGADAILISANDPKAIVPALKKAKKAGIYVVALDTRLDPANIADVTFATDNFKAGEKIGRYANARLGDKADSADVALLDAHKNQPTLDVARDQGFMQGFGMDIGDKGFIGDESDDRVVGHAITGGTAKGGRRAAETLLQKNPDTEVIYAINEPAGFGAYRALKAFGLTDDTFIVTIDGSCAGVRAVKAGKFAATAMQFPSRMASKGVEAAVKYIRTGEEGATGFVNSGVKLVANQKADGIDSISATKGLKLC